MKCEFCGVENTSDSLFCIECGGKLPPVEPLSQAPSQAPSPQAPTQAQASTQSIPSQPASSQSVAPLSQTNLSASLNSELEKVKQVKSGKVTMHLKKNLKLIIPIVIVCLAVFIVSKWTSRSNDLYDHRILHIETNGETAICSFDGEAVELEEGFYTSAYSLDRSVVAFTDSNGTLYVFYDDEVIEVEDDVYSYKLSAKGNRIAYLTNYEDQVGDLMVYDMKSDKTIEITDEAYMDAYSEVSNGPFVLSPEGDRIGFVGDYDDEDGSFAGFTAVVGKEPVKIGKNLYPLALSDDGKYVYHAKISNEDGSFDVTVMTKKEENKLLNDVYDFRLTFNLDLSQVVYSKEGSEYISIKGADEIKMNRSTLELVNTNGVAQSVNRLTSEIGSCLFTGFEDLTRQIYTDQEALYYLDDDKDAQKITDDINQGYIVSKDNQSILCGHEGELYLIKNIQNPDKIVEYDVDDMSSFDASSDLKQIYYINEDYEIMYFNGKKSTKVGDDPTNWVVNNANGTLYYISDEELYFVEKTKHEKISTESDVVGLFEIYDIVFYSESDSDSEYTFYRMMKKDKFELIYE